MDIFIEKVDDVSSSELRRSIEVSVSYFYF